MQARSFVEGLTGLQITAIARVLYEFGGETDPEDGPVELRADDRVVLLDGEGDGERLRIQDAAWEAPFDGPLSEENRNYIRDHGKWGRVDCSRQGSYADFVGESLVEVSLLKNVHGRIAGLRLSASTRTLWFVVECDTCHVRWAHPVGFTEVGE